MKIVINACYGGFSLSKEAILLARQLSGNPTWGDVVLAGEKYSDGSLKIVIINSYHPNIKRTDKILVQVVEQLKDKAYGACASLEIRRVCGKYRINQFDGYEYIEREDTEKD